MLILVGSAVQGCCEKQMNQCVWKELLKLVFHKCKLLWFSLVVFGKLVSFYISHVFPLPPPIARSNMFAFLFKMRNLWSDKKKWSHQACSSPVLRLGHGRSTFPARLSSLVLVTHSEGKWDSAAVTTVWISLCRAPDKQRGKVQRSGSASEMWEGQQSLKCMGTERNLILLQRGEGKLHHVKMNRKRSAELGDLRRRACPPIHLQKGFESILCPSKVNLHGAR